MFEKNAIMKYFLIAHTDMAVYVSCVGYDCVCSFIKYFSNVVALSPEIFRYILWRVLAAVFWRPAPGTTPETASFFEKTTDRKPIPLGDSDIFLNGIMYFQSAIQLSM